MPFVADARASGAISGGGGVATTAAAIFGCAHPAFDVAAGLRRRGATMGVGAFGAAAGVAAASGPVARRTAPSFRFVARAFALGRGGVGAGFVTAIVAGRCSIETTSA